MRSTLLSVFIFSTLVSAESTPPVIKSVTLRGTLLKENLTTQVGQPFNADAIDKDVHQLWSTGRFGDIRVETGQQPDGTNVIFNVVEAPRPEVHKTVPELHKAPPDDQHLRVKTVNFAGDPGIDPAQLRRALRALKARRIIPRVSGLWPGWRLLPDYSPEAVESDLGRLRSLYFSKGYFDASVRVDNTELHDKQADVTFFVRSGPRYETNEPIPQVCSSLLAQRRDAERHGIIDFAAALHVQPIADSSNSVNLTTSIDHGPPYRIGRINFTGLRHYSDALVRGNLLVDEGQWLDELQLRKSADRINQAEMFEPITAAGIALHTNEKTGIADITIHLKERKRGSWNLSGPVGPASFAGPLEGSISSRLPPWGRGLLELSSYTASLSLIAFSQPLVPVLSILPKGTLIPVLAFSRPFTPGEGWKSGFSIVPQLGWQASALLYATTQIQRRLLPLLSGDRGLVPELPVTVEGPNASGTMFCEPPPPRLMPLRTAASLSVRLLGVLTGL
jgi:outer membrane protein insertion porin family